MPADLSRNAHCWRRERGQLTNEAISQQRVGLLSKPVEHVRIVAGGIEAQFGGGHDSRLRVRKIRAPVVDHQPVAGAPTPEPFDHDRDQAPESQQHCRSEDQSERYRNARKLGIRLGVKGDEIEQGSGHRQRGDRLPRRVEPIVAIVR